MAIDYAGLNDALSQNGLMGNVANLIARKQDRELYREQMGQDFSLRNRALGLQEQQHADQLGLDRDKFAHQKEVELQKLQVFKENSIAARKLLDIEARMKTGEVTQQEYEFAQRKKKDLDQTTAQYAQSFNNSVVSKGFLRKDGNGALEFDAKAAIEDDEVFSKSLILFNSPHNQVALGSLKEDENDPISFVEAERVQKENGEWMVRIGTDGDMPYEVTPEQFFQQARNAANLASPSSLAQRSLMETVAAHGHENQQLMLSLNADSMSDDQKRLSEGKLSLSEGAKRQASDPTFKTKEMLNRDEQERIGAGRIDQVIEGLFKEYEDDFTSQGDLKEKMLEVYGANPHELAELGLDKALSDYDRKDIKALAEYTRIAAKGKDNKLMELFRGYHPLGIMADKIGVLPRKKNSTISDEEFSEIKTLRHARGY